MKYLVINGSPHEGNTWNLAQQAMDRLRLEDACAQFDTIHLMRTNLPFCLGCSNCFRLGEERCPHRSIIGDIIRRIEASDGVIVLSSTYNMRETALLKNLFDHLCFMLHRPRFFRNKALILTTTGGIGARQSARSIASFLSGIGFNRCYRLPVIVLSWNAYRMMERKTAHRMESTVRRFHRDIASGRMNSPSVAVMIPYNLFRGMSLFCGKSSEYGTYDGEYWTQDCRKTGTYDRSVAVPLPKSLLGHLFYRIGKIAGKKMVITYRKESSEF
ncbi:MAG: flavodoxin family protein [Sphaerochaetaceae bacterium]|jgi:multimeric flavodoxin WrbA